MAVTLEELYSEIESTFAVKLVTHNCFQKVIEWLHAVEDIEFIKLLHGNELVFNSGLQYESTEWLMEYITELNKVGAGGLIISLRDGEHIPREVVDYANYLEFPLFHSQWDTPYVDIMRIFASVLLKNEQKETNLTTALKNAVYYPEREEAYLNHFERHGFYRDQYYTIVLVSCYTYDTPKGNLTLKKLEKKLAYASSRNIVYEEQGLLVVMIADASLDTICSPFEDLSKQDENVYIGIGTRQKGLLHIHESYEHALSAYQLTKTAVDTNILAYDNLGIYKILSNLKNPLLGEEFIEETLGALLQYDREHDTDYVHMLEVFFENECNVLQSSKKLYCHKNTMTYKLSKIREILGMDMMENENRVKIMLAFYFMKMR